MALDSIAIEGIERHARWLKYSSQQIEHFIGMLCAQRPFETVAEDNLARAEEALNHALQSVQKTRAHYQSLPKEKAATESSG